MKQILLISCLLGINFFTYSQCVSGNCQSGFGIENYSNGCKYEGNFDNGFRNGKGTFYWNDSEKYVGEFKNGKINGYGTKYYSDGCKYEGDFENEEKNGRGTFYWKNGNKYIGEFKNGKINGYGTKYLTNSQEITGFWEDDEFIGTNPSTEKKLLNEQNESKKRKKQENIYFSEVDKNIPNLNSSNSNRFALIIGNEDYHSQQPGLNNEVDVDFAERDAITFKEYAIKVLGIPEDNITLLINTKAVEMGREIKKLGLFAKPLSGKAELYFYYAGHGLPDEITKESFIIPVDVSSSDLRYAQKLNELYNTLTEFEPRKVIVFLDACFSGGARNQGLIAARGVKIKPKTDLLNGNIIVLSASSGDQSSLPYKEKKHGLFTYYLLKKIQETKGNITIKELSDYLKEEVGVNSLKINNKEQSPQINISSEIENSWQNWLIK